jgi:hypothetical protein
MTQADIANARKCPLGIDVIALRFRSRVGKAALTFIAPSLHQSSWRPYRLASGMTSRSGAGPTEMSPVNGRSCAAISNTDAATPVANRPSEMAEAIRLSQWTIAIANKAAAA